MQWTGFLSIIPHLLLAIPTPDCSVWSRLAYQSPTQRAGTEASWPVRVLHCLGQVIGLEVGPRLKRTNQSPTLDSNTDVGQEGCCKDSLGLGHKCMCFLPCNISSTENEAQEMEESIADSLKETEKDEREPCQQSHAGSISHHIPTQPQEGNALIMNLFYKGGNAKLITCSKFT